MIKVAIVDDHKMFRDGVSSILNEVSHIEVIWNASNRQDTYKGIEQMMPDIILMDISLGSESGLTLTKDLILRYPEVKILVLSMHQEENYIIKALEVGALGYILKDAGREEMISAIEIVYKGDHYYSKFVSDILIKRLTKGTRPKKSDDKSALTKREKEILKLIAEEYSNPEIAEELFISIRTVDTHRRNLLDKLGAKNTAGLVKHALKIGLIET